MKRSSSPLMQQIQYSALAIGLIALALSFIGMFIEPQQAFLSYLFAYLFWAGISLGGMVILMIYHLTGGAWGKLIYRPSEAAAQTLPLMVLLFIPLIVGLSDLYLWTNPAAVANEPLLQKKSVYLNTPFFLIRAGIYFVIWLSLIYGLHKWSLEQEYRPRSKRAVRLQRLSAAGIILYGVSITFAAIDWIMSLMPKWQTTAFGLLLGVSQVTSALAFAILIVGFSSKRSSLSRAMISDRFHDLGNFLLMLIMLWAYLAFMQYLVIWSGDLPPEIAWYLPRVESSWKWLGITLVVLHIAVPFIALLSRRAKRNFSFLTGVAAIVLLARLVDAFWLVVPSLRTQGFHLYWTDFAAPIGIGGIWLGIVLWQLQKGPPLLTQTPVAKEAAGYGR